MGGGKGGNFGNTKGRERSRSNKDSRFYGKPGQIKRDGYKETYIGSDGRAIKEIHYSDHGNSKYHKNPHEHLILWDENNNPVFVKN